MMKDQPPAFPETQTPLIQTIKQQVEYGPGHPEMVFDAFGAQQLETLGSQVGSMPANERWNLAVVRCWNKSDDQLRTLLAQMNQLPLHGVLLVIQMARDDAYGTFVRAHEAITHSPPTSIVVPLGIQEAPMSGQPDASHIPHGWSHTAPLNGAAALAHALRGNAERSRQPCTLLAHTSTLTIEKQGLRILQRELRTNRPPVFRSFRKTGKKMDETAVKSAQQDSLRLLWHGIDKGNDPELPEDLYALAIEWKHWGRNSLRAHDLDADILAPGGFPNLFDGRKRPASTLRGRLPRGTNPNAMIGGNGMEDHALERILLYHSPEFRDRVLYSLLAIVPYTDDSLGIRQQKAVRATDTAAPHPGDAVILSGLAKYRDEAGRVEHAVFREMLAKGKVPEEFRDFRFGAPPLA